MSLSAEFQLPHGQVLNEEFASRVALQTYKLEDSLPIKSLLVRYYKDSRGILSKPFPPELIDWFRFYFNLNDKERRGLTNSLRIATWVYETVGELRKAGFDEIYRKTSLTGYPIKGMGESTAAFLKEIFRAPVLSTS